MNETNLPVVVLPENTLESQLKQCCSLPGEARESNGPSGRRFHNKEDSRGGQFISERGDVKCSTPTQVGLTETAIKGRTSSGSVNVQPGDAATTLSQALDGTVEFLRRYITFTLDEQPLAVALWVAHAHVFEAFMFSPYLHVCSPDKRCGKTRLLECLRLIVPSPRFFIRPSEPVLFRTIDQEKPTLLLDEIDTIFSRDGADTASEGLRAVLTAGFQAGASVPRCSQFGNELVEFSVYCPKVIAGIGKIPDTVRDRSLDIALMRQTEEAKAHRFRAIDAGNEAGPLRRAFQEWAKSAVSVLRSSRPVLPQQLTDRQADMFEPLLAIAEMAGDSWPENAQEALIALGSMNEDQSVGVQLLASCRNVFAAKVREELSTQELLEALINLESADAPWPKWWEADMKRGNVRGPAQKLAHLLKPYGIHPAQFRDTEGDVIRGYHAHDFKDAWKRYLAPVTGMQTIEMNLE